MHDQGHLVDEGDIPRGGVEARGDLDREDGHGAAAAAAVGPAHHLKGHGLVVGAEFGEGEVEAEEGVDD